MTTEQTIDDLTPEQWTAHINHLVEQVNAARLDVIRYGMIAGLAFEEAYKACRREGVTWADWCQRHGLDRTDCNRRRFIYRHLWTLSPEQLLRLPDDELVQYPLARLRRVNPAAFDQAIADGVIRPELRRKTANRLLRQGRAQLL